MDARDVVAGYEMILGRPPESEAVIRHHLGHADRHALGLTFLRSDEFRRRLHGLGLLPAGAGPGRRAPPPAAAPPDACPGCEERDLALLRALSRQVPGAPGFLTDFLGNRTRSAFAREFAEFDGRAFGPPIPRDFIAEAVEWVGVVKSVLAAPGPGWRALELGAGWAPWLVATAALARRRGLSDARLYGVEADPARAPFAARHFRDNGLDPAAHVLLHAAVGAAPSPRQAGRMRCAAGAGPDGAAPAEAPVIGLADLLAREPVWDLLHMDVQGVEAEICAAAADALDASVRWLVVGTHSRKIDGDLIDLLFRRGWLLEHEMPARFRFDGTRPGLVEMGTGDGTQVWRNPRLAPPFDPAGAAAAVSG